MPKKVKKVFGENPETVTVLTTQVAFDKNGDAEVEDDIADVLSEIPGYEVEGENMSPSEDYEVVQDDITSIGEPSEDATEEDATEEDEEEIEEPVKPAKPVRPARKAPAKK